MPEEITIEFECRWEWTDGDGTRCVICGETAWLTMLQLVLLIGDDIERTGAVVCRACAESVLEV